MYGVTISVTALSMVLIGVATPCIHMHTVIPTCSYTVLEEDAQTVRVLHRRVSDMREGGEESGRESGGESEEELLNIRDGIQTLK